MNNVQLRVCGKGKLPKIGTHMVNRLLTRQLGNGKGNGEIVRVTLLFFYLGDERFGNIKGLADSNLIHTNNIHDSGRIVKGQNINYRLWTKLKELVC